jgi:hypothetical protein
MPVFVRVTLLVAAAIVALVVLLFLVKILFVAAIIAGLVIGGTFIVSRLRHRIGAGPGRWTALPPR